MGDAAATNGTAPPVLDVEGLDFAHPGQPPLFSHWSVRLGPGVHLLRGGEGRGKSTMLRLLGGDGLPQRGGLRIGGVALPWGGPAHRAQVFRTDPRTAAHDQTPAEKCIATLAAPYPASDLAGLPQIAAGLGLAEHLHKPLYMLSTGSRRKVWLAAALLGNAPLCLVDEPFAALDKASIRFLVQALNDRFDAPGPTVQAWVLADYEAPEGLHLHSVIELGD
jgi:ABC-type transport system involved in cytochrome c biogenesis ATPase subunit